MITYIQLLSADESLGYWIMGWGKVCRLTKCLKISRVGEQVIQGVQVEMYTLTTHLKLSRMGE